MLTARLVALAGNPNVGKSTLFNRLTGLRQHTGNWSGKTVELCRGRVRRDGGALELVDLPGTYSLSARSPEEAVTRDFLRSARPDAVVVVAAAAAPERGLLLALQVLRLTPRVVLALNLADEADAQGVSVNAPLLARRLGVPVVLLSARSGRGVPALLRAVDAVCAAPPSPHPPQAEDPAALVAAAAALCQGAVHRAVPPEQSLSARLDRVVLGRYTAWPLLLLLLGALLWLTVSGANVPSALLSRLFARWGVLLRAGLTAAGAPPLLCAALVDGVWQTLSWVVSVMLPPMALFFPLFTLLEDVGYLPRAAFLLDRAFARCGGSGKQALTTAMSLGCTAVGVTGCRIIDAPRERRLAMLTCSLVPCNGRFPLLLALTSVFFAPTGAAVAAGLLALLGLGVGATLLVDRLLSHTVLRGEPGSFALELPPYRLPRVGRVLVRSFLDRTLRVLGRAAAVAAPAGLLVWLLANVRLGEQSLLLHAAAALDPLGRLLGMDGAIVLGFVLGFPAGEIVLPIILMVYRAGGALAQTPDLAALGALLRDHGWTALTAACTMAFTLFHFPCSTTCLTLRRETGSLRWTLLAMALPTALGAAVCLLLRLGAWLAGL